MAKTSGPQSFEAKMQVSKLGSARLNVPIETVRELKLDHGDIVKVVINPTGRRVGVVSK